MGRTHFSWRLDVMWRGGKEGRNDKKPYSPDQPIWHLKVLRPPLEMCGRKWALTCCSRSLALAIFVEVPPPNDPHPWRKGCPGRMALCLIRPETGCLGDGSPPLDVHHSPLGCAASSAAAHATCSVPNFGGRGSHPSPVLWQALVRWAANQANPRGRGRLWRLPWVLGVM